MLPEKEVKAIHGAVTVEDVKEFKDLAGVCGWDADQMSIAEAAAVGAIIDRLEAYERNEDFDNWGFDDLNEYADEHLDDIRAALWAAFRCGYVQALKDRD